MRKESGKKRRWWKVLIGILAALLVVVAGYVAYVFITYSRIDDNTELEVSGSSDQALQADWEYTAVSYNIGFGAYTPDFTFFMDGGKQSRAASKESVLNCVDGSAETALSFEPDLVLFQEVDTGSTRSWQVDEADRIRNDFQAVGNFDDVFACNYHSAYLMVPPWEPHGASNSGLLTMSRFDISSALRRSLPIATGFKKFLEEIRKKYGNN